MISGHHIRAARALLDLSLDDLTTRTGVTKATISKIESGKSEPRPETMRALISSLERLGIQFLPDGVRKPEHSFIPLSGADWFVELQEDILLTLRPGDELLIFGGDNRISATRPDVVENFRRIRAAGIRMREMVEEGNLYLMGPEVEYRWIPSAHYRNYITVIYGDKVCTDFGDAGTLLINTNWAQAERLKFEFMWELSQPVKGKSIADIRY